MLNAFPTAQDTSKPPQEVGKTLQEAAGGPQIGQERAQDARKKASKIVENAPRALPSAHLGEILMKK